MNSYFVLRKVFIITGPTASGKTKLALGKAKELDGIVINCDSLQVYKDLKLLTAFPSQEEQKVCTHKLFGYLNYDEKISGVDWAKSASEEIEQAFLNKKTPIIVGGTGFYINILINGISPIPSINPKNREIANDFAISNFEKMQKELYKLDPKLEHIFPKEKHHQLIRAYEVFLETGKSISEFLSLPKISFIKDVEFEIINISIDRKELYKNIEMRFDKMLQMGAIEEVRSLLDKINISDRDLIFKQFPIFKAIGAKEITHYSDGNMSFSEMREIAILNSRHYAKRQITWFKNQLK